MQGRFAHGTGVDPHLYKPTAGDISAITSCDLLIYHGLKLEGKLGATLEKAKENQVTTYSVCSVIADETSGIRLRRRLVP